MLEGSLGGMFFGFVVFFVSFCVLCSAEACLAWEQIWDTPLSWFRRIFPENPDIGGDGLLVGSLFLTALTAGWLLWFFFLESLALVASAWVLSKAVPRIIVYGYSIPLLLYCLWGMRKIDKEYPGGNYCCA